jgi:FkbM family methyltransferase
MNTGNHPVESSESGYGENMKRVYELPFPLQVAIARSKFLATVTGTKYWGLDNLDKKVIKIIGQEPGFFVELGANDGISQSNTKHLEMFRGWDGILVEPYPGNFKKLSQTRSGRTHSVNAACVGFDFPGAQMELTYSNLMTIPMEGYSDVKDRKLHAERGRRWLKRNDKVKTFVAPVRTLNSILDEANAPNKIELLSLDVEGGEIEVLNGVDHKKYRFKWILVESRDEKSVREYLAKVGYKLHSKMTGHDYLFQDGSD